MHRLISNDKPNVPEDHPLARKLHAKAADTLDEKLFTYPVPPERLDVFTQFLVLANCRPRHHRSVDTTEMMLQLVAAGCGISAIPEWLVRGQLKRGAYSVRISQSGI